MSLNVSLTTELEALIHQKVKSGRYHSASEVVREALRLLEQRDRAWDEELQAARAEIERRYRKSVSKDARFLDARTARKQLRQRHKEFLRQRLA